MRRGVRRWVALRTESGGDTIRRSVNRDFYRQSLVNGISTTFNDTILDSHTYAYDALSRPTSRTSSGATTGTTGVPPVDDGNTGATGVPPVASSFGYNDRSEIVSATISTNHFLHAYDTIGNQTNHVANATTNTFTHNVLNQMLGRGVPTAPQAFAISHDLDGNMTSDGFFSYSYDAANRLASVSSNGVVLVANEYDYRDRRMKKTTPTTETTFVYDGWNLMHETAATISGATTNTTEIQYFWGIDLSDTFQGAGGVGGLLAVSIDGSFYFPAYDNIGNVTKYIDESGNVVAAYEYDAFGRIISQTGPMAEVFRIRFSSKYYDPETGLYYYGYRFYSPALMRWLNRDPIEELGCLNIYEFAENNSICKFDKLGDNIYLYTGNDSGRWLNDQLHQTVVVDKWASIGGQSRIVGKVGFTFSFEGNWEWYAPRFSWLDFPGFVLPGYWMEGEIKLVVNPPGIAVSEKKTTCIQDIKWLKQMRTKVGKRDVYSVGRHNCRNFSQSEFNAAPGERIK